MIAQHMAKKVEVDKRSRDDLIKTTYGRRSASEKLHSIRTDFEIRGINSNLLLTRKNDKLDSILDDKMVNQLLPDQRGLADHTVNNTPTKRKRSPLKQHDSSSKPDAEPDHDSTSTYGDATSKKLRQRSDARPEHKLPASNAARNDAARVADQEDQYEDAQVANENVHKVFERLTAKQIKEHSFWNRRKD